MFVGYAFLIKCTKPCSYSEAADSQHGDSDFKPLQRNNQWIFTNDNLKKALSHKSTLLNVKIETGDSITPQDTTDVGFQGIYMLI